MLTRKRIIHLSLFFCLAISFMKAGAQPYSYIYIQADKGMKFNILVNGSILPQYGRSYAIIPKLLPGITKMYILFTNNDYPPQRFNIGVPDSGFRNFLLTYYNNAITLYDVDSRTYQNGEPVTQQEVEENMPAKPLATNNITSNTNNDLLPIQDNTSIPEKPLIQDTAVIVKKEEVSSALPTIKTDSVIRDSYGRPIATVSVEKTVVQNDVVNVTPVKPVLDPTVVIPDMHPAIDIDKAATFKEPIPAPAKTLDTGGNISLSDYPATALNTPVPPVVVKDNNVPKTPSVIKNRCGEPLASKAYDDIYLKALQKTDKERLKFLLSNLRNCFSSNQLRVLVITLSTDPERYTLLKQAYPQHITDRENFPALESTLTKREWKDYFELLLQ